MSHPEGTPENRDLPRRLGTFDSIMMMIGIVIGSGVFLTTGIMAREIPSAPLLLLAWAAGGLLTLAGALTFAELGAALPEAGGQYVYLREAYGHLWGFLFGWILFLVSMGGSIAALGVGFAEYVGHFFPAISSDRVVLALAPQALGLPFDLSVSTVQLLGLAVILFLSACNYVGVEYGKGIQNGVTVVKIATLVLFVVLGLTIGRTIPVDLTLNPRAVPPMDLAVGFGVALIAVSWAFDGWNNITYIAGEIRDPGRNLPLALVGGTVVITGLYLLVNWVYLAALPLEEMEGVVPIARSTSTALFGSRGAGLVSAAVIVSTFGALNGAIFVGPRVYWAMARDGIFFRRVGEVHPRFRTPAVAIAAQAVWAGLLTLTGTYEQLFTYVVFVSLIYWIAATASVFALRRKRPDLPRPYRTWGYPVVPLLFILATAGILVNTLVARPLESLAGLGIALTGVPVYFYWRRRS